MSGFNCADVEPRLQDFVAGDYGPAEERRMREHLAFCESCRREERELRRLLTLVAELPRAVEPARDLWTGVAARLSARSTESGIAPGPSLLEPTRLIAQESAPRSATPFWNRRTWAAQIAAAITFMIVGAALSRGFPTPAASDHSPAHRGDLQLNMQDIRPASSISDLNAIEADFLRAKESLWLLVHSHRDQLSPVKLEIVQQNLIIVDDAIRDLREALADDPGNRLLEGSLLAQHRRGINLLRRLTRSRQNDQI